jgi:hypothetical protein
MYEQQERHCTHKPNHNSHNTTNNDETPTTTQSKWIHFIDHVEQARLQGESVIVSDEAIHRMVHQSTPNMQHILDVFQKFSQVRVIFGYRRYFEWIVSEYNEEMKTNAIRPAMSFVDWYNKQQQGSGTKPSRPFARLDGAALQRFQSVFSSVQMFNLHEEMEMDSTTAMTTTTGAATTSSSSSAPVVLSSTNTIMANFLCRMIPEAQHACEAARAGTLVPPDQDEPLNLSVDYVDSSYIAQQVIQQVYKKKKKKKAFTERQTHQLVVEIQSHFDRSITKGTTTTTTTTTSTAKNDTTTILAMPPRMTTTKKNNSSSIDLSSTIPKRCLSKEELEQLFQQSLQIERDVLGLSSSPSSLNLVVKPPSTQLPSHVVVVHGNHLRYQPSKNQDLQQHKQQEEVFRKAFTKYVKKEKFCGVDFEQLWDNTEWRTLLKEMAQSIRNNDSDSEQQQQQQ